MAMIENEIISSVYSEDMYSEVTFLEPKDFTDPINRKLGGMISEVKGDTVAMIARISYLERSQYTNAVLKACLGIASYKVAQMGLELVSIRYRNLLNTLLDELLAKSESLIEKHYLTEIKKEAPKNSILEIAKGVSDYFESKAADEATTYAKERLRAYSNYVITRNEKIKNFTNGNK